MAFDKKRDGEKVIDVDASMKGSMIFKDPVNQTMKVVESVVGYFEFQFPKSSLNNSSKLICVWP